MAAARAEEARAGGGAVDGGAGDAPCGRDAGAATTSAFARRDDGRARAFGAAAPAWRIVTVARAVGPSVARAADARAGDRVAPVAPSATLTVNGVADADAGRRRSAAGGGVADEVVGRSGVERAGRRETGTADLQAGCSSPSHVPDATRDALADVGVARLRRSRRRPASPGTTVASITGVAERAAVAGALSESPRGRRARARPAPTSHGCRSPPPGVVDGPGVVVTGAARDERAGLAFDPQVDGHRRGDRDGAGDEQRERPRARPARRFWCMRPPLSTRAYRAVRSGQVSWLPGLPPRAFPGRRRRSSGSSAVALLRVASPVTVAGPRRIRTGFP